MDKYSLVRNEEGELVLTYKNLVFIGNKGYEEFIRLFSNVTSKANTSYIIYNHNDICQGERANFVNEELSANEYVAQMFDLALDTDCVNKALNTNLPTTTE